MPFPFPSPNEEIALTYHNVDIYPLLGVRSVARFHEKEEWVAELCRDPIQDTGHHNRQDPSELKITVNDLQAPHTALTSSYGFWSLVYSGATPARRPPRRNAPVVRFCPVVRVGGIEFAILPLDGAGRVYHDRIWLSPADVQKCLNAAMEEMQGENGGEPVSELTGRGLVVKPRTTLEEHYPYVDDTMFPRVNFEWKITHLTKRQLDPQVQRWRHGVFGSQAAHDDRLVEFLDYLKRHGLPDPLEGERSYIPFRQAGMSQEYQGQLKRRSGQMSDSEESSPSSKRLSYTSQASMAPSLMAPSPTLGRTGAGPSRHQHHNTPSAGRDPRGYQAQHLAPPPFRSPSGLQSMPPMMAQTSQSAPLRNLPSTSSLAETQNTGFESPYQQQQEPQYSHLADLASMALAKSDSASSGVYGGDTAHTTGQYTQSMGGYRVLPSVWSGYGTSQPPSTTGGYQYGGTSSSPATTQYQTSQSVEPDYGTTHPASMETTVQKARNVFHYMESQPGSSSGGRGHQSSLPPSSSAVGTTGVDPMRYQVTSAPAASRPDLHRWWNEFGEQMRSTEPNPWKQSGNQGYRGGGSGSRRG